MLRVRLISAGKLLALALFVSIVVALVSYLAFRKKNPAPPQVSQKLQGPIVAVFNNTRYAHEVDGRIRFVIIASTDRAYGDGSHELEQVRLESHGTDGTRNDVVTADRAKVSNPANLNTLDAEFISNVVIQIADDLTIKTSYLHYDHSKGVVETKERVEFDGSRIKGHATGVTLETAEERAHLLKDVDLTIKSEAERKAHTKPNPQAKSRDESPDERAARRARKRARKQAKKAARAREGVVAKSKPAGKKSDSIASEKRETRIQSQSALLEKKDGRVTFIGGVRVSQGRDEMRADRMTGFLDDTDKIERIEARGNSRLVQAEKSEIESVDMDFFFEEQQLTRATATGGVRLRTLGSNPEKEAHAQTVEATFFEGSQGNVVETIKAEGGAVVIVHAPEVKDDKINPATRELRASTVSLRFYEDGKNIESAQASGDAMMKITPVRAEKKADRKTIRAPRMSATFYEEANRVKTFTATDNVKVEIEAMIADEHPPRVTTSRRLDASFLADSQDVERIAQEGDFKYVEGDRNAVSERASYDGTKEWLELRGHRPMAWDAKARTQADEIDYDRRNDETHARGDVRTTYYSRETTEDATPFKNTRSPIFMTADRADARNRDSTAVYTGNARGWQDDNFVRGDRIELYQKEKRMVATGNVESALYDTKQETAEGKSEKVPVFASAKRMTYSDIERVVHYDGGVKARQGTDRIEAEVIDVYLMKETNEVERMTAQGNVVMTQPGRRGVGDHLLYIAEDERAVLTGRAARVDDEEKGTVMGAELTLYKRDDRISVQNQQGTGRVRSTHRLTKK
ncbi:MAG: LPS export ABC transporter periplasmic protein LptC [Acidobacteriota bacterium]